MTIPDVDAMERALSKKSGGTRSRGGKAKKAKPKKLLTLYDDEGNATRYDVNDPNEKAGYDEARDRGDLTGKEFRKGGGAASGFTSAFAKSLGGDLSRALTGKGKRSAALAKRAGGRLGSALKAAASASGGLSSLSKALPVAVRLGPVAAAVGALWYLSKRAEDVRIQDLVAEYAANQEAYLKRPMRDDELKAYLPVWRDQAWSRLTKKRANAPAISSLR